jgi:hypothetical protein
MTIELSPLSTEDFFGSDSRSIDRIIADDATALQRLGITAKNLAEKIRAVFIKAERALGNPVPLSENVTAVHHESRGQVASPIVNDGSFAKGEVEISDGKTGKKIFISPLSIHLIEKYGFLQGKGARYRVEADEVMGMIK